MDATNKRLLPFTLGSAIHGVGVEAFPGANPAVYEAIAGGRVSAMPRARLVRVLNLRHLNANRASSKAGGWNV